MNWYKIKTFRGNVSSTAYKIYRSGLDECHVEMMFKADGYPYNFEVIPCSPDEVPIVQRGLAEATTEQLKYALMNRGWKVTLS